MNRRKVCTLEFDVQEQSSTAESIIHRLDDGNDLPGFEVEKEDGEYVVYEVA